MQPTRTLLPTWFTVVVVAFLVVLTALFLGAGIGFDGPMALASIFLGVATGSTLVAALASLARRRPLLPLDPRADGTVVVDSPLLLTLGLVVAWVALLASCATYAYVAVTDLDAIEAPGMTLVALVGAVASLPDLVRLLTGRLHRWRLTLDDDGVHYQGYRTRASLPWPDVRRVELQARRPTGVRVVGTRAGDADVSFVIPAAAFTVPAEQLVDELGRRR